MAVLSSKPEHYTEALKGLVTLYLNRGYPIAEVHKWLRSNITKRWNERLMARQPQGSADVLVLKTQYNLAWNYFNTSQLGDTIFNYWREWLSRANTGTYNSEYPAPDLKDPRVHHWVADGMGQWDLRNTNLFNSRIILSCKRTQNMLDLTNLWKKSVLETQEDLVLDDLMSAATRYTATKCPHVPNVNTLVTGLQLKRLRVGESGDTDNSEFIEHVLR